MEKIYSVTMDGYLWGCSLKISDDENTLNIMKESIMFFSGGQRRLDKYGGDIIKTFCFQIASVLFDFSKKGLCLVSEIIDEWKNVEGYPKIDGSHGITLWLVESLDFEFDSDNCSFGSISCI